MLACASFFAGVGGIDLGFEQAGFDVVYANEFCEKASDTFKQNHEVNLDTRDIRDVPSSEIPDFDVMLAGFPCQAFSVAGYRQGFDDEKGRGNLYFELERIMKDKRPSIVFLENVKNLVGHDNGRTFRIIRSSMEGMGYKIHHKVMNACDYGDIPQNRERIYVVGFLDDEVSDCFSFPDEIPLNTTIGDIFEFESRVDDKYYYGEDAYMYDELKMAMTSQETVYQWRRKYVRENKSRLCPTLTANMGTGGHNVPLIKTRHGFRKLTPKECFMIQGFDSSFVLPENVANSHLYKQAGNSVVIPVIERIALEIRLAIEESGKIMKLKVTSLKNKRGEKLLRHIEKIKNRYEKEKNKFPIFRVDKLESHDDWMEWFLYWSVGLSGKVFRDFIIQNEDSDVEVFLEELKSIIDYAEHSDYYVVPRWPLKDDSKVKVGNVRIGTQAKIKNNKGVSKLFKTFLTSFKAYTKIGERLNMPGAVSENMYFLCGRETGYYRYISGKFNEKGVPKGSGDGFKLNSESVEEVEIKSTISGGVRNTFSKRQIDRSHEMIYISVDAKDLRKYLKNNDASINVTIYVLNTEIYPILRERDRKKESGSNSRPEFPSTSEIEELGLYSEKRLFKYSNGKFEEV